MKRLKEIYIDDEYIVRDKSTSDGAQDKYYKDGYWYKADYFGGEGMAEYLASVVLECTNLCQDKYVTYDRCIINDNPGCYSRDFCFEIKEGEYITFYRLYNNVYGKDLASVTSQMDYDDAIEYVADFIKKTTDLDIREYLANTFFLDRIILNTDRHFNNMGVIFDGTKYMVAPIFDNGKSLLVGENKRPYSKSFSPSYDLNYRYLEKYTDVSLDVEKLQKKLRAIENSPQKSVLEKQVKKIQYM